ncbi:MAG: hypothetical protein R2942_07780 [Ignavibacteria bacterium]
MSTGRDDSGVEGRNNKAGDFLKNVLIIKAIRRSPGRAPETPPGDEIRTKEN